MTTKEFRTQYDIYYNSIASNLAPSDDDFELSVFLTNAQRDLVVDIYTGRIKSMSFESTEEARRYLAPLVESKSISVGEKQGDHYEVPLQEATEDEQLDFKSRICYIIMEYCTLPNSVECLKDKKLEVVPITHDELLRTFNNPFRGMTDRRILRVDENNMLYLYSKQDLDKYNMVYVRKPNPIIISNLEELYGPYSNVEGENTETQCELPEIFHREILNRAVLAAKQAYMGVQPQE